MALLMKVKGEPDVIVRVRRIKQDNISKMTMVVYEEVIAKTAAPHGVNFFELLSTEVIGNSYAFAYAHLQALPKYKGKVTSI